MKVNPNLFDIPKPTGLVYLYLPIAMWK